MSETDFYQLLGVPRTAPLEQIKAAYRRQALRHHPDKHGGSREAEERFKRCSEAFATLADAERRAAYDARQWSVLSPGQWVGELFDGLTGGRWHRRQSGRDLRHELQLSLEQCAAGGRHRLSYAVESVCEACAGLGAAAAELVACGECAGRGELRPRGVLGLPQPCPHCGGRGLRGRRACRRCAGVGVVELSREVELRLRPGCADGETLTVAGRGEPGRHGGRDGDLYVIVRVLPHPLLVRHGDDLLLELPVAPAAAALGASFELPTLEGEVRLHVPAGTQAGAVLRLSGRGMPRAAGGRGELLVTIRVETPVQLEAAQQALWAALAAAGAGAGCYPRAQAFAAHLLELRVQRGQVGDAG